MAKQWEFTTAKRENIWLRMLLLGPDGSGKTKQALEIASKLFGGSLPIVGIDSEHGRMKLYADKYRFEWTEIDYDQSPESYVGAMKAAAEQFPGGVLIPDSISHEWMGTNGVLQAADRFGDWKQVRPRHTQFIEEMLTIPMHVIATCRLKTKYEVSEKEEGGRKKQVVTKLGLGPVQDDSITYNFDVVGRIDLETHETTFSNRCEPLVDKTFNLIPGDEVAGILTSWLSEGEPPEVPVEAAQEDVDLLRFLLKEEGLTDELIEKGLAIGRRENRGVLTKAFVEEKTNAAEARKAKREEEARQMGDPVEVPVAEAPAEVPVEASS